MASPAQDSGTSRLGFSSSNIVSGVPKCDLGLRQAIENIHYLLDISIRPDRHSTIVKVTSHFIHLSSSDIASATRIFLSLEDLSYATRK